MKRFYIFIIVLIILTVVVSAYVVNYNEGSDNLTKILKVFSASQSIISIYIVYMLYDRFGTSKKILDKQNDIIIEYLEELKKIKIRIIFFEHNKRSSELYLPIRGDLSFARKYNAGNKKIMVRSEEMFSELKKLNELVEHPLFPLKIKNEMDIFKYNSLTSFGKINKDDYAFVSFKHGEEFNLEGWMLPNKGELTVLDYIDRLEKLVINLEKWINQESSIKFKINFK